MKYNASAERAEYQQSFARYSTQPTSITRNFHDTEQDRPMRPSSNAEKPLPAAKLEQAAAAAPVVPDLLLDEDVSTLAAKPASAGPDPQKAWQMVLGELELQMPSATYNTWVRDTWVLGYEDGEFIIGLPNAYALDWLENRLRYKIKRMLTTIIQRQVQVTFQVMPRQVIDSPQASPAPLYEPTMPAAPPVNGDQPLAGNLPPQLVEATALPEPPLLTRRAAVVGQLNVSHTFDTFVVGSHNRLAHAAATAVAEKPGQSFNPLFIYGGVGLGKTHLLHAIGNHAQAHGYSLLYCSSEQFTNDLIGAIRSQSTEQFRNKYREVDVLLIDDIQFIGGKESTQEEFFHTFNYLHAAGRQVILSSDRPPKALATLEERLRSRFEGGLQTDISQPDFETRVAILQAKASRLGMTVDPGVLMLVAERVDSNIRELEGALNRLALQAKLVRSSLSVSLAAGILDDLAPLRTACSPQDVVRIVAQHFGLQPDDLTGRRRTQEIAQVRQITMYLLSEEHDLSLSAIGDQLGGRDHSTVRYGIDQIAQSLERDETVRNNIMTLREQIYTPLVRNKG